MQGGYPGYSPAGQQGGAPLSSPFGAGPAAGGGQVRSSPFAGGGGGGGGPPQSSPFPGAPPPAAGGAAVPPPPTADQLRNQQQAQQFQQQQPFQQNQQFQQQQQQQQQPFQQGFQQTGPTSGAAANPFAAGGAIQQDASMHGGGAGGVAPGGGYGYMPKAGGQDANLAAFQKEVEVANSPAAFMRATVSRFPNSISGKQKLNMPLGLVLQPLAPVTEEVPSVNFGAVGTIVRCKSCRSYINPFVQWQANGRQWTCNLCGLAQATPDTYYSSLDETGKRMDRHVRPELSKGAVEYIAPGEYMVRPPQPPVFLFLIDVSYTAVATGLLDTVVTGIKETIQSACMPGGERMQMGIITYDSTLHFYNLNSSLSQPQMLVVSDLDDIFLPLANDILVSAPEGEAAIVNLLDSLPSIFAETKVNESCLGSAVRGAFMAMKNIGGKLLVFSSVISSLGNHALKSTRDNPRLLNTDREVELLRPVNDDFKELAKELAGAQITVELFMAAQAYVDLASLASLAKYTAGDIHWYPQFTAQTQGMKLRSELMHVLTRYMGWEAVMRIRVSRGWKITNTFGHFFVRGSDLLVVPNCHSDQTFAITIDMEENVTPDPVLCVQSALLYTNSDGERRIRVHTWAAVTTQNFSEIINSVDVQATAAILANMALENSLKPQSTLAEGRNFLHRQCQQIVSMSNMTSSEALQFLPLYIMGMLKSTAFRATNDIPADYRTYLWMRMETLSVSQLAAFFYPRMMGLHQMPETCGVPDEYGQSTMPDMLNLTSESLAQDGVFLLEDGESILMWIGRGVQPNFLSGVFGVRSFEDLDPLAAEGMIGNTGDATSTRIANVIRQVRLERSVPYLQLHIIRQGDPKEGRFFSCLIEDRTHGLQSTYMEFLQRMGYRPQQ
eukprot:CAMPEP_0178446404 /NCGR_PEP_ID=MMETSP0689_2-20121128/40783_1 /TAXON_ID=160604 /ORGANISM="Amphidinium massartii, Strain CS-259" /LENGTH=893 /DNA_ID=CAMNT_0020071221 /DNA_START=45 /DNA_END=2723 /DNA_ORIENTATION=-